MTPSPNVQSFSLFHRSVYWAECLQMTLNTTRLNIPHECVTGVPRCRVTGHLETSAPNDPKMTLTSTRSNVVLFIYNSCALVPNSALPPNSRKMTLTTPGSNVPHIGVTSVTFSRTLVTPRPAAYALRPVFTSSPKDLKVILTTAMSNVSHYMCYCY